MTGSVPARPVRWVVGPVTAVVLLVLAVTTVTANVIDHDGLTRFDRPWHQWVTQHRSPVLDRVMEWVSIAGGTAVLAMVATGVVLWLVLRRRWSEAVLVAVTTGGAGLLVPLFQYLVERPRQPVADRLVAESGWSYPSGHSLGATAVLGVLALVVAARLTSRAGRVLVGAASALLVVVIGLSRIYLGVHWPSDVFAGWLVGALWLVLSRAVTSRRRTHGVRFDVPVVDERTDQALRTSYLTGRISIGTYLDRRFGTAFSESSAGEHRAAG